MTTYNFVHKEAGGKILDGGCDKEGVNDPGLSSGALRGLGKQFINTVKSSLAAKAFACKAINDDYSYLKVPVIRKVGGGVRVKRLLMYNKGVDAGSNSLYGTEYIYENQSTGQSFGVATNEPFENKGENPLVGYMDKRKKQSKFERWFQGRDDEQFEGPASMNMLPAASVGYSRVIKKNIHQDKYTGGGYSVVDYYTAKDYPFDGWYTKLNAKGWDNSSILQSGGAPGVDIGLFSYSINTKLQATQGYCSIQNQMHGQIKSVAEYPGMYDPAIFYNVTRPQSPVSSKTYSYFEPGEQIPMYDFNSYSIYYDQPGKEMDITVDRHSVEDKSSETRITGDVTVGTVGPVTIPWTIAFPITSGSQMIFNSVVVNKTIHYPAILKRVSVMKDGYIQNTDNVAFDPMTTQAVLTRTYDSYDGLKLPWHPGQPHNGIYTNYNVPASSQYELMGQKARNDKYCYYPASGTTFTVSSITGSPHPTYGVSAINTYGFFRPGDMIALYTNSGVSVANVVDVSGGVTVAPVHRYNATIPTGTNYTKAEIIRSAYTNQLKASMGGFTEYGVPPNLKNMGQFIADMNSTLQIVRDTSIIPYDRTIYMSDYDFTINDYDNSSCNSNYDVTQIKIEKTSGGDFLMTLYTNTGTYVWSTRNITAFVTGVDALPSTIAYPDGFQFANLFGGTYSLLALINATTGHNIATYGHICPSATPRGILKANLTTYRDNWDVDTFTNRIPYEFNDYEAGRKGRWRPFETYTYLDETIPGSDAVAGFRVYKAAGVSPTFTLGPWKYIYNFSPKWAKTNTITQYSPNGFATEEKDGFGVYSAAKYGYHGMLPYAVVQGAPYESFRFESFENKYSHNFGEDNAYLGGGFSDTCLTRAHTGNASYKLEAGKEVVFENVLVPVGGGSRNHIVRFWAQGFPNPSINPIIVKANGTTLGVTNIANVGLWRLYECRSTATPGSYVRFQFIAAGAGGDSVFIDDIKIQPAQSQMSVYVYDNYTYKLAATFNEGHFATKYQYNGEGKLIRKIIETPNGIKTVEDAVYHTPQRYKRDLGYNPAAH